jgi:hypothetical protein
MKITVKQLKQLIREQVEMTMSEGPTGGGDRVESVYKEIVAIWRDEAGFLSDKGREIDQKWRAKAEELAHLPPQGLADGLEEQRKDARTTFKWLQSL